MTDYIIIGQGLAGSLLAYQLIRQGKNVIILNDESLPTSSQVAGGMFNPITGKHLSKTWMADELFPFMKRFYTELESEFGTKFLYETNIYRPFANENQKKQFLNIIEKDELQKYIDVREASDDDFPHIEKPLGGLLTHNGGWLDVPLMLSLLRKYFIEHQAYVEDHFDEKHLKITDQQIYYKSYEAKKIVFCQGYYSLQNSLFNWLRLTPVKGETLIAEVEDYEVKEIVNQGSWVLPIRNKICRFGATYSWQPLDWIPTETEKELLLSRILKFFKAKYRIIDHQAGIRPATQDRRPLLGNHPVHKNVFIFNGLGTKGVSLAPYFADEMLNFMENQKVLHSEVNIERFYALYSLQ